MPLNQFGNGTHLDCLCDRTGTSENLFCKRGSGMDGGVVLEKQVFCGLEWQGVDTPDQASLSTLLTFWVLLNRNEIAHSVGTTCSSLFGFIIHQTVKVGVERLRNRRKKSCKVVFHHQGSHLQVCWYLTIYAIITALSLNRCQDFWRGALVPHKAAAQATQIFWHHGRVVKLWKCVVACEESLIPLGPIMNIKSFWPSFEERVCLPGTTRKTFILHHFDPHFFGLGLCQSPTVWWVFQVLFCLS